MKGTDLREHGSGNAGTTNAFRVLGWPIGIVVLVIDIAKGFLAVFASRYQGIWMEGDELWMLFKILLGALAVTGHIFPVFAGFRGGKGVATMAGVGLALHPQATLAVLGVYLVVLVLFRISSLASLLAAISFPLMVILVFDNAYYSLRIFSVLVALLIILTHRANIRRLIRGEEKKFRWRSKGDSF